MYEIATLMIDRCTVNLETVFIKILCLVRAGNIGRRKKNLKQGNLVKNAGVILLAATMIVTSFPALSAEVRAAELPDGTQFATKEELKAFNTNDSDGSKNPAKVYFGRDGSGSVQAWWIAGSQNGNLTLFAASPLSGTEQKFYEDADTKADKAYDVGWGCTYQNGAPTAVYANHYGASPLRTTLKSIETNTSCFSKAEQDVMNNTTIYTYDVKNFDTFVTYSTTDKLYLAYGSHEDNHHITVGTNSADSLNAGLRIDKSYWGNSGNFWLRAPYPYSRSSALAVLGNLVGNSDVTLPSALVPAVELNLPSVLFASAAPSASSEGELETKDVTNDGAFTLRYSASNLGSAQVAYDYTQVELTDVPSGTYLVAQNKDGAWAKAVSGATSVSASEMGIDSFENCRVWLEKTDTTNRMAYAKMATMGTKEGYDVIVADNSTLKITSGNATQKVNIGSAIADITVEAAEGYYLPDNYINGVTLPAGFKAGRNGKTVTISGTPQSDVTITLPNATENGKVSVDPNSLTFETTNEGYVDVSAKSLKIQNAGNVEVTNLSVVLTGTNAAAFTLDTNGMKTTLAPGTETIVSVKPNKDLGSGTYQAGLKITGDSGVEKSVPIAFTVEERELPPTHTHSYGTDWKADSTNHWHECTCGDKADIAAHQLTWIIDKEATADEKGSKHEECEVCGYKEAAVEIPATGSPGSGYEILEGENQTYNGRGGLTVRANGDFSKFTGLKVDGAVVDPSNYDAKEGSTIVTLKENYLSTLSAGDHRMTFVYDDGEVSTNFTTTNGETSGTPLEPTNPATGNSNTGSRTDSTTNGATTNGATTNGSTIVNGRSPKTGDKTNLSLYLFLFSASGLMIVFCAGRKKMKAHGDRS